MPVCDRLQRQQRLQQHRRARQQHKRSGNLRNRECPQTPCPAARHAHAAGGQADSVRPFRRTAGAAQTPAAPRPPAPVRRPPTACWNRPSGPARAPRTATRTAPESPPSAARSARPAPRPRRTAAGFPPAAPAAAPPVLAPSAARITSSPSRRIVRARIRLATLEHGDDEDQPRRRQQHPTARSWLWT